MPFRFNPTTGNLDWSDEGTLPVPDTTSIAKGSVDNSKQVRLEVDGITASAVRVVTIPDKDITLDDSGDSRTPTAHETSHESGGGDELDFDQLAEGTTYKKFLATERTKLTGIEASAVALATVKADADVASAISLKHSQNTDTDLDATFEATFVKKVDTVNVLSDITSTGANIEDAVTKKHTQNTDTSLGNQSQDLNMNTHKVVGVVDPVNAQDAATKAYVDAVASGLDLKDSVRVVTDAALPACTPAGAGVGKTLTADAVGILTVDGVATVLNNRILIKNQVAGADNGIYKVTTEGTAGVAFVLTRATDFDQDAEVTSGAFTFIEEGTINADNGFALTTNDPITVDTTALVFSQFSGAGQITAGTGMTKSGNTLNVIGGIGITANADDIAHTAHTGDVTGASALTIAANAVTNAKAAQMATKTYKGRTTAATGNAEDVPVATVKADLVLVKADVGLDAVDNTADINKPISTAQQTALNAKSHFKDIFSDYIVAGLLPVTSANLTSDISAGQAYVKGKRIDNAVTSNTYSANLLTWVDVDYDGNYVFTEVDNTILVEDCEDAWDESVDLDVTSSADTVDFKVGLASAKLAVALGAVAGDVLATEVIAATDISGADRIRMWIKCSVATLAGDLQLLLGETAIVDDLSATEVLDIPALVAATWTEVNIDLVSAAANRDAIISAGLKYVTDLGACDIWLDDIQAVTAPAEPDVAVNSIRLSKVETNGVSIIEVVDLRTLTTQPSGIIKYIQAVVFDFTTAVAVGDGKFYFHIPADLNGLILTEVHARVITVGVTGTTDIQIHNVTGVVDMLSTALTIDSGETGSDTAAIVAVIDTLNDDIAVNDLLRIDVDVVSTTSPEGLLVTMGFKKE